MNIGSSPYGEEDHGLREASGPGRRRQPVAADRPRARSARPQHHGILQGLQREDRADGEGHPDSGDHHRVSGPLLHLRDEAAPGHVLPQEGGGPEDRQEAGLRLQDPGQGPDRRQDHRSAASRDRREEDARPQLRFHRRGGRHDPGFRPGHGPRSHGLRRDPWHVKFDETIEVSMNLGVDPRHADQMVRGVCNLPNGSGRTVRVAVFARGAKADDAKAAGADIVGAEDLLEIVQGGKIDFDRCIATPDMMPLVGRLGKVLGPRGLMPNPKVGTVTMDVKGAVAAAKGGAVEFRVEKAGIVHAGVGKVSFDADKLVENIKAFADAVAKAKPAGAKGTYVQRIAVTSTMGPGVKVEPNTRSARPATAGRFAVLRLPWFAIAPFVTVWGAPPRFAVLDRCPCAAPSPSRPVDASSASSPPTRRPSAPSPTPTH
ncbi:hypothetical protein Lal_00014235 [Lupinus albus]|nr:hypothetical protein Lal_00014235 [Lupinus albus]